MKRIVKELFLVLSTLVVITVIETEYYLLKKQKSNNDGGKVKHLSVQSFNFF